MDISHNPFSLQGKTVLITGASSGIGRTTAVVCSQMGAKVIITGRNEARLDETLAQLAGEGHGKIVADLSCTADMEKLVAAVPCLDGCVNNAGYNIMQLVPFIKDQDMRAIFEVNTFAPLALTHLLVKNKKISKGGSFVFTSSIAGRGMSTPANSLYSATKGAISAFCRNAAVDLAGKKIRCNSVAPGMIETPLKDAKDISEEQWAANLLQYPLKRFGRPEDVAYAIVYLLSDAACWVTGAEIVVDGGRSLK